MIYLIFHSILSILSSNINQIKYIKFIFYSPANEYWILHLSICIIINLIKLILFARMFNASWIAPNLHTMQLSTKNHSNNFLENYPKLP